MIAAVDIEYIPYFSTGNIGNAKLEGLVVQLDLTGNRFNIALVRNVWFSIHNIANLTAGCR
jgi:hypothetical protein